MSTILYVVGARPNYPKVAPLLWSADRGRPQYLRTQRFVKIRSSGLEISHWQDAPDDVS